MRSYEITVAKQCFALLATVSWLQVHAVGEEAVTYGHFSDPLPARDPAQPYVATGPQYYIQHESPSVAEELYWGIPSQSSDHVHSSPFLTYAASPATDFITQIVDASGALERDAAGNVVARGPVTPETIALIGDRFITPVDDGNGGFTIPTQKLKERSNSLLFDSRVVEYEHRVPLELGTFTYHNGTSPLGTEISDVTFRLGFASLTEAADQYFTDLAIRIVTTPNVADNPATSADYLYFADYPQYGSFRVYEGQTASVPLTGFIDSLHFTGFGDSVTGSGFLTPSIELNPQASPVPDAGPGWLGTAVTLALIGASTRKNKSDLFCRL